MPPESEISDVSRELRRSLDTSTPSDGVSVDRSPIVTPEEPECQALVSFKGLDDEDRSFVGWMRVAVFGPRLGKPGFAEASEYPGQGDGWLGGHLAEVWRAHKWVLCIAGLVLAALAASALWTEAPKATLFLVPSPTSTTTTTVTTTLTPTPRPYINFVTVETRADPLLVNVDRLTNHFRDDEIRVINLGEGETWHDYKTKCELVAKYLRRRLDDEASLGLAGEVGQELVAFIDGSDIFWGGCDPEDFVHAYHRIAEVSGARIVFSAEVVCGEQDCNKVPFVPDWAYGLSGRNKSLNGGFWKPYADGCHGTWNNKCSAKRDCGFWAPCSVPPAVKFLNSGFFIGPLADVTVMMEWVAENYERFSVFGDQSVFAVYWLEHQANVTLDYLGSMALSISDLDWKMLKVHPQTGLVENTAFDRVQCLIHGNGRGVWFMKHVLEQLTNQSLTDLRNWSTTPSRALRPAGDA